MRCASHTARTRSPLSRVGSGVSQTTWLCPDAVVAWLLLVGVGLLAVLLPIGCTADAHHETNQIVGIWRGTLKGQPLSMEFRPDGRAILVYAAEDGIELAAYRVDDAQEPAHLDIIFDSHPHDPFLTLLEFVGDGRIRIGDPEQGPSRPQALGDDAITLTRGDSHVLARGMTTAAERDEALEAALAGDIWFGGTNGPTMLSICEALFRYQFANNASGRQQRAQAYYLSIAGRDPPPELLQRFEADQPPVRPRSQFQMGQGLLFRIDRILWIDDTHVEATGGYYEGGLSSSRNTYHLRLDEGRWRVIRNQMNSISQITEPEPFHAQPPVVARAGITRHPTGGRGRPTG